MPKSFLPLLIVLLFANVAYPAAKVLEVVTDADGKMRFETRYKLTPAQPEEPFSKYSLYWDYAEQTEGNAALFYEQAYTEMRIVEFHLSREKNSNLLQKIWTKTIDDPPLELAFLVENAMPTISHGKITPDMTPEKILETQHDNFVWGNANHIYDYSYPEYYEDFGSHLEETRKMLNEYDRVFVLLEKGSRCEKCDFGISYRTAQPDFEDISHYQNPRSLTRLLNAKIHFEIYEGRYVDAIKSIKTGMHLCKHISDEPTLISTLIGIGIHGYMHSTLMEMLDRPDAPNLYWSITGRPNPYFNSWNPYRSEKAMLLLLIPSLKKAVDDPNSMTDEEWKLLFTQIDQMIKETYENEADQIVEPIEIPEISVKAALENSRKWLESQGKSKEEIDKMIPEKIVGLQLVHEIPCILDGFFSDAYLPLWENMPKEEDEDQPLFFQKRFAKFNLYSRYFAAQTQPAIQAARGALRRTQLQTDTLRISQAIRIYMAEHDGNLPEKLDDIKSVPVPMIDPYTGKPFRYRLENGVGIIEVPEHNLPLTVYFEKR